MFESTPALYIGTLVLYALSPNRWHKALPCLVLFRCMNHEVDLAFLFAALGDFLLHENYNVLLGTLAFACANLIFGSVFLQYNYFDYHWQSDVHWTRILLPTWMLALWAVVCFILYWIANDHWCLFSVYALTMSYALYQGYRLQYHPLVPIFMTMFLVSDLMVLLAFEPQDLEWVFENTLGLSGELEMHFSPTLPLIGSLGEYIVRPFQILHGLDLALYWGAMAGLHWSFVF